MAFVSMPKATILLVVLAVHVRFSAQSGCQLSDIVVSQSPTGKVVEGQREYRVSIENRCACPQAGVRVRCFGMNTVEPIDTGKIRPVAGGLCVVANGGAVARGAPVTFTYAFQTPQSFPVVSATAQC